jgi:hypothetical protein
MTKSEQLTEALAARGFRNAKVIWRGLPSMYDGGYHAYADGDWNLTPFDPKQPGDPIGDDFDEALNWIAGTYPPGGRFPDWPGMTPDPRDD